MPDQPRPIDPIPGFAAKTPIRTPEGSTSIENTKPGDVIQTQPDNDQADDKPRWWESN